MASSPLERALEAFRREGGVSAVEFALVFPLLILLIFGMFAAGMALHSQLSLDHAAREAARFGTTLPIPADDDEDDFEAPLEEIRDRAVNSAIDQLEPGIDGRYICVAYVRGSEIHKLEQIGDDDAVYDNTGDACFVDDRDEARVQVLVGRTVDFNVIFFRFPIDLDSDALGRYERGTP